MGAKAPPRYPSHGEDQPSPHVYFKCLMCGTEIPSMGPGGAYCREHDTVLMEHKLYDLLVRGKSAAKALKVVFPKVLEDELQQFKNSKNKGEDK